MRQYVRLIGALSLAPLMACATPDFHARQVGPSLGVRTDSQLLAEGRMQAANGNFGLAIDAFRRAIRQSPQSVDAFDGLAAAYDALGRFDLAQRFYEEALAFAPADIRLQAHYAASLRAHGMTEQAAQLEAAISRVQAAAAQSPADSTRPVEAASSAGMPMAAAPAAPIAALPTTSIVGTPMAGPSVSPLAARPQPAVPAPVVAQASPIPAGPRLERLNTGEVLLITRPEIQVSGANGFRRVEIAARQPNGSARPAAPPARPPLATTRQSVFAGHEPVVGAVLRTAAQGAVAQAHETPRIASVRRPPTRILNAVGRRGQASRMETHLRSLGWQQTSIGDANTRRSVSVIIAPAASVRQATALARSLPFRPRVVRSARVSQVMLVLGNDAVAFDQQLMRGGRRS